MPITALQNPQLTTSKNTDRLSTALFEEVELIGLEIFKSGRHSDSLGHTRRWSDADLDEIAAAYDPGHYRAPLTLSHDVSGNFADPDAHGDDAQQHQALIERNLAFGFPKRLKRVGKKLMAYFEPAKLSQKAINWIRSGQVTGISSSFYMPEAPTNPTPGRKSLRHIAMLGVDPPAVKGMALEMAEGRGPANVEAIQAFGEESGVAEYVAWVATGEAVMGMALSAEALAEAFSRLRDHMIASEGEAAAEAVLPRDLLSRIQSPTSQGSERMVAEAEDLDRLHQRLDHLERVLSDVALASQTQSLTPPYQEPQTMPTQETEPMTTDETVQPAAASRPATDHAAPADQVSSAQLDAALARIQELEQGRVGLVQELAEQRTIARHSEWRSTINDLRLPAALTNGHAASKLPGVTDHAEGEPYTLAEFAASLGKEQAAWFKSHLQGVAGIYTTLHQELTPEAPGQTPSGQSDVTPEKLVELAEAHQGKQRVAGVEISFNEALSQVMVELGIND